MLGLTPLYSCIRFHNTCSVDVYMIISHLGFQCFGLKIIQLCKVSLQVTEIQEHVYNCVLVNEDYGG